jgi:carbonic anhydrase/acetyltransferase-like protein (isoleucine patch superfamily)
VVQYTDKGILGRQIKVGTFQEKPELFRAEGSHIVGNVSFGNDCSVWYNAVIRGDEEPITIGNRTNIQDNCTLHVDKGFPMEIGSDVTVGHGSILHGCIIGDNTLIGMGSVILGGAVVGEDCIIGAGSLVTQGTVIPDGMLALGTPAKVVRPLTEEEKKSNQTNAITYMMMKTVQ